MFAIDSVKLRSNASKAKSGTRANFERHAAKLEAAAHTMLERYREQDEQASVTVHHAPGRRWIAAACKQPCTR